MEREVGKDLKAEYEDCIQTINLLTEHIKLLSNQNQLQNLEDVIIPQQYLTLLANSLYTVNSLAFSYSSIKNIQFPKQFNKVQEYFKKAKNPLIQQKSSSSQRSKQLLVLNKQAAKRLIQSSIK